MVSAAQSRTVVDTAIAAAHEAGLPPMTVAVLDAGGQLVAFLREDGSSLLRERIARGKARGALGMGTGSRALAARAETHPLFITSLIALSDGELVPVAGGVLVRDAGGVVVGAVGVSGASPDADEACAVAGIHATGLTADPGCAED